MLAERAIVVTSTLVLTPTATGLACPCIGETVGTLSSSMPTKEPGDLIRHYQHIVKIFRLTFRVNRSRVA
jgi:hypothetical protein